MQDDKEKNSEPTPENIKKANKGYNPKDRDFERTEEDLDNVSKSEKENVERKNSEEGKERLKEASTTPNKDRIG